MDHNIECIKCKKPSKIIIHDHHIRGYCSYECADSVEIGNCHICKNDINLRYIYKVGYDTPHGTIDHIYSTCGREHYKEVDNMVTGGNPSKKINLQ